MAKQVKIKDIAQMAGVSAGTVDRILHNRGNVSKASQAAVEKVLSEVGYRYNIHTSAVALRKGYDIVISIPSANKGEYWGAIQEGIEHALDEFSDININCTYSFYNQFDAYSCRSAFDSIIESSPDAVIIGPTFIEETKELCNRLTDKGIPFVFVDSAIDGTSPIATFSTNQYGCGFMLGKLLHSITPDGGEFALFRNQRAGNRSANNSVERKKGFDDYFESIGLTDMVHESSFSVMNPEDNEKDILEFMEKFPRTRSIAVLNSRGYIIADILDSLGIGKVKMISFDLTANNARCVRSGKIEALLCQRPALQGFLAVKAAIRYLLYNKMDMPEHTIMPIDIIMKQNLDYYREFLDI